MLGCSPLERWCQQCRKQLLGFNQSHPLFFLLLHFLSFSHLFRLHSSLFHFLLAVNMDIKWMERVNQIISPCINHHHLNSPRLDFPQQKASFPSVFCQSQYTGVAGLSRFWRLTWQAGQGGQPGKISHVNLSRVKISFMLPYFHSAQVLDQILVC